MTAGRFYFELNMGYNDFFVLNRYFLDLLLMNLLFNL